MFGASIGRAGPLRVVFASHTANTGCGAENVLMGLVSELDRGRVEPVVLVPEEGGPMEAVLARAGVEVRRAPMRWWIGSPEQLARFPEGFEARVRAVRAVLKEIAPDLVVTNTCVIREAAEAARLEGLAHVWYSHEMLSRDPWLVAPQGASQAYADIAGLSRAVLCVSQACREEFLAAAPGVEPSLVEVAHTGIPAIEPGDDEAARRKLLDAAGFPPQAVVACFVGVLSKRKGVPELAECAVRLAGENPLLRFVLVGPDGGAADAFKARVEGTAARAACAWIGARPDPMDFMRGADMLVLPSLSDPFPLVVQEAMHLARPVVATASGGASELVLDGVTGVLTPVGEVDALASAVARLAGDSALRRAMGEAGRERIRSVFSREGYLDKMARLFERAAQGRQAGGAR